MNKRAFSGTFQKPASGAGLTPASAFHVPTTDAYATLFPGTPRHANAPRSLSRRLAIVATTPDDSHTWNLISTQLNLEKRGFMVENLGACTPAELIAETVRARRPSLVAISTINGHGSISIPHVLETLERYQMKHATQIIVGGLLTTDVTRSATAEQSLLELGCAAVFTGMDAWDLFDKFILGCRHT